MMTDNCHRVNTYCIMPCHTRKRIGDIIKEFIIFLSYFFIIYKNIAITGNLFFYIIYKCDIYICVCTFKKYILIKLHIREKNNMIPLRRELV